MHNTNTYIIHFSTQQAFVSRQWQGQVFSSTSQILSVGLRSDTREEKYNWNDFGL